MGRIRTRETGGDRITTGKPEGDRLTIGEIEGDKPSIEEKEGDKTCWRDRMRLNLYKRKCKKVGSLNNKK